MTASIPTNGEPTEPIDGASTVEEVMEVGACCPACAHTFLMVRQIHQLIDGLMTSPMARMMLPGGGIPGAGMQMPPGFLPPGVHIGR